MRFKWPIVDRLIMAGIDPFRTLAPSALRSLGTSISTLEPHRDIARPIEDRHVACYAAKDDDARRGYVPTAVVDDEIVIAPQSQRPRGKFRLPLHLG